MTQAQQVPTILAASGDYTVIQRARAALDGQGFTVQAAYSFSDALFAVEQGGCSAVLADSALRSPQSGEPFTQALASFPSLPVVLLARAALVESAPPAQVQMVIGALDERTLRASFHAALGENHSVSGSTGQDGEVETLFALGKSLTEVLDLSEVLNRVVAAARHLTGAEEGMILLPDDEAGRLYLRAKVGIDDEVARNFRIKTEDTLAGQVFSSGQPSLIGAQGPQKVKTQYFVNSLVYVPILLSGRPIGVLGVNNKVNDTVFRLHHQQLLLSLASYAAIAIENARIHEQLLAQTRDLQSLVDAGHTINSSVSLDVTLTNVCEQLRMMLHAGWAAVYEWDRGRGGLRAAARSQRLIWRLGYGPVLRLGERPALRDALDSNRLLLAQRQAATPPPERAELERLGAAAALTVPVRAGDQLLGAVRAFFGAAPAHDLAHAARRAHTAALELLVELAENASQDRAGRLFRLAEDVRRGLGADWCELALLTGSAELETQLASGHSVWLRAPYPFVALDDAPDLQQAVSAQLPLVCVFDQPDLSPGARALLAGTHSAALLALPLVQRGQSYGLVMCGSTRASHIFSERDINLGRAIAGQAATALENARLVHDLEQSLQDLKDAQERLVQAARLSAMGELAAAVAHQINNPLTTILVDTELMLLDEPPDSRDYRSLIAISRAGKRAASVVRRLLATARPVEENAPVEPIDVVDTIEGILSLVKSHIEQDSIRIVARLPEASIPPVLAVQGQLDDIWLNLLLNAHDALAGRENARIGIEAAYTPEDSCVDVVVWDNGPGVPEAIRQDIFEPFFTTKPVGEGTGLGLHICRQVVNRVGGSISVDNASEGGARFLVRLPVRKG
ncbi:MAG: hypothetical protein BroJett033_8980 [Chloroflexota bacterium]|nr:MAG: hypothetical protein BroJett033_8980 [Chloroflexota bacterium]